MSVLSRPSQRTEALAVTIIIAALLAWLPLQTPLAIVAYQYLHVSPDLARAILLLKDALVAGLIMVLLVVLWRHSMIKLSRVQWFDWLAILYLAVLVGYTLVPWLLGSRLPALAVLASFREFIVPVELYVLGRLAMLAGADVEGLVRWSLVVAVSAGLVTVFLYVMVPVGFWSSTLDLVTFERVVQGIPTAHTLWDISLLGQYGVGNAGTFPRAVGPFTHPVGTAHYFVAPLLLAVAAAFEWWRRGERRESLLATGGALILAAAVITPISRGSWIAAFIGLAVIAVAYRRVLATVVALGIVGAILVLTPPFSYSIGSALTGSDSSVVGHQSAIQRGLSVVTQNPAGIGVGQGDTFGSALSGAGSGSSSADAGAAAAGVGENMYLAAFVSVGPVGMLALVGWMLGLILALVPRGRSRTDWIDVALLGALLGYAVSAAFASALMRFTTSASFWLLVGLAIGRALEEDRPSLLATLRGLPHLGPAALVGGFRRSRVAQSLGYTVRP